MLFPPISLFFFFNDTATTEIYTLSLHDALPIYSAEYTTLLPALVALTSCAISQPSAAINRCILITVDRKSTRLNSSHQIISYAVFCLKKKKNKKRHKYRALKVSNLRSRVQVDSC